MQIFLNNNTSIDVWDKILNTPFNKALISQVLRVYIDNGHSGTKKQKNRGEVAHGHRRVMMNNRKSGRGRFSAPSFRGGGVCFAAVPYNRVLKINKKTYSMSIFMLLSELFRSQRINFIEKLQVDSVSTKDFIENNILGLDPTKYRRCLLLVGNTEFTDNLILATRNIYNIKVLTAMIKQRIPLDSPRYSVIQQTNPYDLAYCHSKYCCVFATKEYLKDLESMYRDKKDE